jgi:phosphohistidine swiveling domain-containing protein
MFYGRPYWSSSAAKKALCKVPGYDEERFDLDVGIHNNYGNTGPVRTPRSLRTILHAVPVGYALGREFRRQLWKTENYGQYFLPQELNYRRLLESCDAMDDTEFFSLVVEVLQFHTRTDSDYLRTVYNHVNYQTEFKKLLDRIQAATGEPIAPLVLMSGLLDVSHMKIQQGLLKLVRTAKRHGTASREWDEAQTEFLSTNYFHGDAELDISTPRWRECPDRIREMVESIQQSGIEPKEPEAAAREQLALHSEEVHRVRAALQRSRWQRVRFEKLFCKRLKTSRTYASRREEIREYSMRADDLVRRYLLQAGRRLHRWGWLRHEADIFMLYTDEVKAIAFDRVSKEQILAASEFRELMYRGYRMVEPPGELGRAVSPHVSASDTAELSDPTLLKGVGCSVGKVTAKARVLTALAESDTLLSGEILVTRFTDPAWTPMMGLVVGLITEAGGLLSHGAVIAREYGLPAVLNVPKATEIIKTGQVVEIDGSHGTVKILDASRSTVTTRPGGKTMLSRVANSTLSV